MRRHYGSGRGALQDWIPTHLVMDAKSYFLVDGLPRYHGGLWRPPRYAMIGFMLFYSETRTWFETNVLGGHGCRSPR